MTEQIEQSAERLKELRTIAGVSQESLAREFGVSVEKIEKYESGATDIPISYLTKMANKFNVEVTALLTGEEPKLRVFSICRKDKGVYVERFKEYEYESLAYKFANKKCDPFLVTVQPENKDKPMYLNAHSGHEFDYVVEGSIKFFVGSKEYILNEGDCIYLDSAYMHAMSAVGDKPAKFIAIVLP